MSTGTGTGKKLLAGLSVVGLFAALLWPRQARAATLQDVSDERTEPPAPRAAPPPAAKLPAKMPATFPTPPRTVAEARAALAQIWPLIEAVPMRVTGEQLADAAEWALAVGDQEKLAFIRSKI